MWQLRWNDCWASTHPHLHDVLTQTVATRLLTHGPADAVVITLNEIRSQAWGVSREFTTLESVEAYA